jgi:hypothetical protein
MNALSFAAPFTLVVALAACGNSETVSSTGSGGGGAPGAASSSSHAATGSGGTGGSGCPAGAPASLSLHGLRTTSFDNTMDTVVVTLGNPNDSTLSAYVDTGTLMIEGQNADWQVDLELHLEANVTPPISITAKSFPNDVVGACFSSGLGMENTLCNDDAFKVTVTTYGCERITGTFLGRAISLDGFAFLDVSSGAFDVPIGAKP